MNHADRLERELTVWFQETAVPRKPEYTAEIIEATGRVRQRPRWAFPERWLPAEALRVGGEVRALPWRTVALLAVLALLVAATVAVYVGSRSGLPAPFGPAANGVMAYSSGGDIHVVDPVSGERRPIVTGPAFETAPRFSLDGTRLAFLRTTEDGQVLVVASADGANEVVFAQELVNPDTDSLAWSHDGRSLALATGAGTSRTVHLLDTITKALVTLPENYAGLEVYWRPPDGRQLAYLGGDQENAGLFLYSLNEMTSSTLVAPRGVELRPTGWTPDGRRFAFSQEAAGGLYATHIVDVATGAETVLDIGFGRLSNDGTRVVGYGGTPDEPFLCVAPASGGPCAPIGAGFPVPDPETAAALRWSPDDQWILSTPATGEDPVLLDPDGETPEQPPWLDEGADSWQRVAR
jgi:dipeptidyl aminopeptidase/acylaminoacyl peptidase